MLHKEQSDLISSGSLVSVKHVKEVGKQKEQVYFAISKGACFKVWQLVMSDDGKSSTGSTKVLEVDDAHNT